MGVVAPDVAVYILAGGKSSRMGMDKAFVALDGRPLLARALEVARAITADVCIVGSAEKFSPFAPVVEDIFPGCGPLGGIHAALLASPRDFNFILAVDLPFVSATLAQFLIQHARKSEAVVTVPDSSGLQPLCAVYRRAFADAAEEALKAGRYKIDALFECASTQVIGEEELAAAGFSRVCLRI